jgi:hypothetical protein
MQDFSPLNQHQHTMLPEITHVIASLIANPPGNQVCISVKEAAAVAVNLSPDRYNFSTEYALRRYRAIKRGSLRLANPLTAQLWDELVSKVDRRLSEHPEEDDFAALEFVLCNESPSQYFLTPQYAEKNFYSKLHQRKQSRTPALPPAARFRRISKSQPKTYQS